MTQEESQNVYGDLIYLVSCAVNKSVPDASRISGMDLPALHKAASRHLLASTAAFALESAGVHDKTFFRSRINAVRRAALLDAEWETIAKEFERQGIRYLPLKGVVLQHDYPEYGMREMSDHDILYDSRFQQEVLRYMLSRGYEAKSVGKGVHDSYLKPPVYNFEFHTTLFSEKVHGGVWNRYYTGIMDRAVKDAGNDYGYSLSPDDFYIYITTHAFKHYDGSGTGIRTAVDNYVFRKAKGKLLDWEYIQSELSKLEIADFELTLRELSDKLFSYPDSIDIQSLSEEQAHMYHAMIGTAVYGTTENRIRKEIRKRQGNRNRPIILAKLGFLFHRLFPGKEHMKMWSPMVAKYPVLLPVYYIYRFFTGVLMRRDMILNEIKALKKI